LFVKNLIKVSLIINIDKMLGYIPDLTEVRRLISSYEKSGGVLPKITDLPTRVYDVLSQEHPEVEDLTEMHLLVETGLFKPVNGGLERTNSGREVYARVKREPIDNF